MVSIELVVVMGGTLLTGGAGFGGGAFIGILIQDQLQTYIAFDGTLSNGDDGLIGLLQFAYILMPESFLLLSRFNRRYV